MKMTIKEGIAPSTHKLKGCGECGCELFVIVSRLFADRFDRHFARIYGYACITCGSVFSIEEKDSILDFGAYERAKFGLPIKK
jgi:predicted  nucleic acid-binding Zn-ribbon protein